jgi:hypothetical protein
MCDTRHDACLCQPHQGETSQSSRKPPSTRVVVSLQPNGNFDCYFSRSLSYLILSMRVFFEILWAALKVQQAFQNFITVKWAITHTCIDIKSVRIMFLSILMVTLFKECRMIIAWSNYTTSWANSTIILRTIIIEWIFRIVAIIWDNHGNPDMILYYFGATTIIGT